MGKSAIAAAGKFELTFTNTEVYKIIRTSKTNQDNLNLYNTPETKHHQLHFYVTNTADFLLVISENDSENFLPVSTNMNYLENGLKSIYKFLAYQA